MLVLRSPVLNNILKRVDKRSGVALMIWLLLFVILSDSEGSLRLTQRLFAIAQSDSLNYHCSTSCGT
jgi:hypothetical protein